MMNILGFALMGLDKKRAGGTSVEDLRANIILSGGLRREAWGAGLECIFFHHKNKALVFRDRNTGDFLYYQNILWYFIMMNS